MNTYSLTKQRTLQWLIIILVLCGIAGAYFYYQSRGATEVIDNRPSFEAPLTTSIELERGVGSPTFTRADGADRRATVTDFEGLVRKVKAGEARFEGARRVENLLTYSEDFSNAAWIKGQANVTTDATTAPDGTATADKLVEDTATGNHFTRQIVTAARDTFVFSVYAKAAGRTNVTVAMSDSFTGQASTLADLSAGTASVVLSAVGSWTNTASSITSAGNGWYRISVTGTRNAGTQVLATVSLNNGSTNSYAGDGSSGVYLWGAQLENIAGQANQAVSEYVSNGVLSAPYHGANVDGVKYFDTTNGNTVASNVVTPGEGETLEGYASGSLPGTSGSYFSTPDSSALDITGDIDIRVKAALTDWTPSGNQYLVSKYHTGGQRSYFFAVNSAGTLRLQASSDGNNGTVLSTGSSVAPGFADGTSNWVRVTWRASDGRVQFFTSLDGETWTQLGTDQSVALGSLFDGTADLAIGSDSVGNNQAAGKIYRAQVFDGIDGTIAADFDPSEWSSGNTWTSRTEEVWTRNGSASLWKNSLKGYLAEGSRTNTLTRSEEFDDSSWTKGSASITANAAMAPDGTLTADALVEDGTAGVSHFVSRTLGFTSGTTYTVSVFVKASTRNWVRISFGSAAFTGSATERSAWFNLASGALGTVGAGTTASITPQGNGWYRITASRVASSTTSDLLYIVSQTADNEITYNGASVTSLYLWGAQLEAASFASSYIPTTTASVTRAVDVLRYQTENNIDATRGSISANVFLPDDVGGDRRIFIGTATNGVNRLYLRPHSVHVGNGGTLENVSTTWIGGHQRVAANWDPTLNASFYRDGTKIGTTESTPSIILAENMYVGSASFGGSELYGNVKNFKIWKKALDDETLEALTAGTAGATQETSLRAADKTGLIGYWSFDDERGGHATDFSGNDNTGTLTNMEEVDWISGRVGTALDFDGTNETVTVPDSDAFSFTDGSTDTAFSISAWIKMDTHIGFQAAAKATDTASTIEWAFGTTSASGAYRLVLYSGGSSANNMIVASSTNASADVGSWVFLAATYDGSESGEGVKLYRNGIALSTTTTLTGTYSGMSNTDSELTFGSFFKNNAAFKTFSDGVIDEVRLYNRVISADEIAALMEASAGVKVNHTQNDAATDNLVGLWSFNGPDIAGTTAYDRSGEGNNGTISGATPAIGKVGQALSFDGTGDYVTLPDVSGVTDFSQGQNFAVSFWLKAPATQSVTSSSANGLVEKREATGGYPYAIRLHNQTSGTPGVISAARHDGTNSPSIISSATVNDNTWHHVVFTKNGSLLTLYIDGINNGTATDTTTGTTTNNSPVYIGTRGSCACIYFQGSIDEVRIYDTALSAAETQNLYNLGR